MDQCLLDILITFIFLLHFGWIAFSALWLHHKTNWLLLGKENICLKCGLVSNKCFLYIVVTQSINILQALMKGVHLDNVTPVPLAVTVRRGNSIGS